MKRIVEEDSVQGIEKLLGENIQVWCLNYIYAGKLSAVGASDIILTNACVVYETGKLGDSCFKTFEKVQAGELYVRLGAIESYCRAPQLDE